MASLKELDIVKPILEKFGELSGLHVQPQNSVLIGLNTAKAPSRWQGFPVQEPTATSRQLGYWVGNHDSTELNWAIRLENIQRRLRIATTMGNSVVQRVTLFNAIALPAILYTGRQYVPSKATLQELTRLQKGFVWSATTRTEPVKHK
ncbi:hypothetical protein PHYSODRAFT_373811, partial [Phytophthora sojae]